MDNKILKKIIENFNGGPVGLETLASLIGEDKDTIEVVYEPFYSEKDIWKKHPEGVRFPIKNYHF